MSLLPAVSSRPFPHPTPAAQGDARSGGKVSAAHEGHPHSPLGGVALSQSGVDLSAALSERIGVLGNSTIDAAQDFLGSFAQRLLGDAADGATISFDSASLSVEAGFAAGVRHGGGPRGSYDAAAFRLSESSHFIGKGTITTEDGESFEFEIEVQYEARIQGSMASLGGADAKAEAPASGDGDGATLPTLQLPDIDFPGSLGDLFKLLGQQLRGDVEGAPPADGAEAEGGTLSLRMLNLVNNVTQLEAGTRQVQDDAKARAKMLAEAYGAPAATTSASTTEAAATAPAPAVAAADASPADAPAA
jgi:hypothetical protein